MYAMGGCYPGKMSKQCLNGQRVDSIRYHFRWNMEEIDDILEPGTVRITSIRQPLDMFRSTYNYYYYEHKNVKNIETKCDSKCARVPFAQIAGKNDMRVDDFIAILPDKFDPKLPYNYRVKNWQAFELGMDHLNENVTYIEESLKVLERQFDLVILIEYYQESLVLLAELLCVPYKVIWQKQLNPRKYEKPTLRADLEEKFNNHFKTDIIIYNYFEKILQKKIDDFGRDRMEQEILKMTKVFENCNKFKHSCDMKSKPIKERI